MKRRPDADKARSPQRRTPPAAEKDAAAEATGPLAWALCLVRANTRKCLVGALCVIGSLAVLCAPRRATSAFRGAVATTSAVEVPGLPRCAAAALAAVDPTANVTATRAEVLSRHLGGPDCGLDDVLFWTAKAFPGKVVQFSSFGPSGMVVIDRLAALHLLEHVPVAMIDTLHLFQETHDLVRNASDHYPAMTLARFYPKGYTAGQGYKFDVINGDDLWTQDFQRYTYLTKVEPTARALRELSPRAWITGRRRAQGGERAELPLVEADEGRYKVNPLVGWTSQQVWAYIRENGVPYNALHDQGYKSIGDSMNTRPVEEGESERAGRFMYSGEQNRTECGMHSHKARMEAYKAQPNRPKLPEVACSGCTEVTPDTFTDVVLKTASDLLIEFYSPLCGHCQHFGPAYQEVVTKLAESKRVAVTARFDLFNHKVPPEAEGAGFDIEGYPSIWLVRPNEAGLPRLFQYEGPKEAQPLLHWISEQLEPHGSAGSAGSSP